MLGALNFSVKEIRKELGLSQSELADLVGIGSRAIQSYEQEWRQPPEMVERMLLLLLIAHRNGTELPQLRCWEKKECLSSVRQKCIAYKTRQGHLCWFLTGTMCAGQRQNTLADKLQLCLDCCFMKDLLNPTAFKTENSSTLR